MHTVMHVDVHVLMRDEKEGKKKQAMSNKQQGKATQDVQGSQSLILRKMSCLHVHVLKRMPGCIVHVLSTIIIWEAVLLIISGIGGLVYMVHGGSGYIHKTMWYYGTV